MPDLRLVFPADDDRLVHLDHPGPCPDQLLDDPTVKRGDLFQKALEGDPAPVDGVAEERQRADEDGFRLAAQLLCLCEEIQCEVLRQRQRGLDLRLDAVVVGIKPFSHGARLGLIRASRDGEVGLRIRGGMIRGAEPLRHHAEHHRMAQEPIVRVCVKDRYPVDPFLLLDSVVLGPYPFERGLHLIRMGLPLPETLHNPLCFALPTDAGHAEVR